MIDDGEGGQASLWQNNPFDWTLQNPAGVDEAGRGPLAGPVIAASVVLDPQRPVAGLDDSKKLTAKARAELELAIKDCARSWCVARADVAEIDELNILRASLLAMERAVRGLGFRPDVVYVDGNMLPNVPCPAVAIVQGDGRLQNVSAASILAKVARDREMTELAEQYPGYGFEVHKGYGTKQHLAALQALGPTPLHRKSFAPVAKQLAELSEAQGNLLETTE